jgi:cysteinyl-tRNA synthetase
LTYDLIKRVLMYLGYDVTHICNLTDIDDKIIARANAQKIPQGQIFTDMLTRKYERYFFDDLAALNVVLADRYPRAAEHIPEMMDMILALEANGLAYEADDGSWYFATSAKDGYGQQLINLNRDEMEMTEDTDSKRDPQDFALWKAFKPGVDRDDASWESDRFKRGRPGWHLECSAMARKYLGDTIDIHGGGIDLKFPHHENEIAQSEGVTGQTFCNCWLHNGFVNINDEKMSKSLGNFLTLRTACPTSQDVRAYRYLVMSSQYSKQLNFTPQAMDASKSSLKRIDKVMNEVEQLLAASADDRSSDNDSDIVSDVVPKALSNFEAALLDDLSMPRASASLFSLIKAAEKELKRVVKEGDSATPDFAGLKSIVDAIRQMDEIFGIFYDVPLTDEEEKERAAKRSKGDDDDGSDLAPDSIPSEVMQLVMRRSEAKEAKDWELADSLRTRITELGFAVKDVKGGEPVVTRVEQ